MSVLSFIGTIDVDVTCTFCWNTFSRTPFVAAHSREKTLLRLQAALHPSFTRIHVGAKDDNI